MASDSGREEERSAILLGVALLGFTACVTQLLMLREFLAVFAGNELVLGLILGNWLFLTGIGGLLGRFAAHLRRPLRLAAAAQMTVALLPAAQITGARLLPLCLPVGRTPTVGEAFTASALVLLPFCLLSGFLLAWFSGLASDSRSARQIGSVYVFDTLGGILGGLLFSFAFVHLLAPFQIATLLLVLNLSAAFFTARVQRSRTLQWIACGVLVSTLAAAGHLDAERRTEQAMFPGLELLSQESTPYGSLAVVRTGAQISAFENGVPVGSSQDEATAEEVVHYALAQRPDPKRVLLVSGGLAGAHREAEKYPIDRLDYVELDPAVSKLAAQLAGAGSDPRTHLLTGDARRLVRESRASYDAILLALPDPSSAWLNRFYTTEFFAEARRALRPGGVLSFGLTGAENYAGPELRLLASAIYRSLGEAFPDVVLIPGARQFFVASDEPLRQDFDALLRERGVATHYVNRDYLAARLTPDRLEAARTVVREDTRPNRDLRPVSYYAYLRVWLSELGGGLVPLALLAGTMLAVLDALLVSSPNRAIAAAVGASGLAGMGLEVTLLVTFQIGYGYVYQQAALIVTGFLAGAAAGAAWTGRQDRNSERRLFAADGGLAVFALVLALALPALATNDGAWMQRAAPAVYPALTALCGFLVGAQLPAAAWLTFRDVEETAGRLYALDLLGACCGALAVSAFCLPLLGITATCVLLASIKTMTAAALWRSRGAAARAAAPVPSLATAMTFTAMLLVLAILGFAIVDERTGGEVYSLSLSAAYVRLLAAMLAFGIVLAMMPPKATWRWRGQATARRKDGIVEMLRGAERALFEATRVRALRWAYFLSFSVAVFYPIFRCYFRVPYLFCHVCPRKCVFGFVRPYLVPAALVMNLNNRYWCHNACPIGTLQDGEARACPHARPAPAAFRLLAVAVLLFTAIAYFQVMRDLEAAPTAAPDWYTFFFNNVFAVSAAVVAVAVAVIVVATRLRRTFCEALCPVGTFSQLLLDGEQSLRGRSGTAAGAMPAGAQEP